ncbi:hypothetical protein PQO01_18155 [Lentisphaera marina]|uniref:hypothetical protein n=1 Tax=Lentisphaera marina TaxID=1111041 RepID=UPI00236672B4|nr:hypothetical protein [Lentisphaera marina]MDD7986875.1 hypothetical protein [Lentisphaera marina]
MMTKSNKFTMVEVIIALGILTIAMFTLVGLLPAGLQNSEDTEHSTYAPIVADGFGTILTHLLNGDESGTNWDSYWDTADVDIQYNTIHKDLPNTPENSSKGALRINTTVTTVKEIDLATVSSSTNFDGIHNNISNDPFLKQFTLYGTGSANYPDLFGGYYKGLAADGVTEAEYGIRVWYGEVELETTSGTVVAALEPEAGDDDIIFTVEVSWPPQMEYQRRIAMGNFYKTTKIVSKKP